MQTIDFIKTSKWIFLLFSPETQETIFTVAPFRKAREGGDRRSVINQFIKASHEATLAIDKILTNPLASEVLTAFHLDELLDRSFPLELMESIAMTEDKDPRMIPPVVHGLWDKWEVFTRCIAPIEQITIPQEVIGEQDFDETLTIELQYEHERSPKAESVASVLISLSQLYTALAITYGIQDYSPLRIIYADSGSSVRFDLKGLGDPIRRIKEFFVEGWNLIRHRRVDDFHQNNKALLESLESVKRIQTMLDQGTLGGEDASRLKRQIIESALSLFEAGVLPREIQKYEIVQNDKLMAEIQRKLLPPASIPDEKPHKSSKRKRPVHKPRRSEKKGQKS